MGSNTSIDEAIRAGQNGETENRSPRTPCTEPKVVRLPDQIRRQPKPPVTTDDPDGFDPGPAAA
jgi:hypothetical protein